MSNENETPLVRHDADGPISTITIDRPKALNALNADVLDQLEGAFAEATGRDETRAVIITSTGSKAFVAGADIAAMKGLSREEAARFAARGSDLFRTIERAPVPVIAAVDGFALGGGCELALACDFIIASTSSKFGQPEVNLGLIPGFGGTQRLMRKIAYGPAMELLLSGRMIDAEEALRIGLVNRVVEAEELADAARSAANAIASKAPLAVAATKRVAQDGLDRPIEDGLAAEVEAFARCFETDDAAEGIGAFLDKRKPSFTGK